MPTPEFGVLIADDEPAARRGVRQLLADHPAFTVVAECRNGAEVLRALDATRTDVVFLDIQMPGLDGFEVIRRRTPERMPATVFLTAYDEHALKAFEAQAIDYLVKPVSSTRFAATMRRLERQLRNERARAPHPGLVVSGARGSVVIYLSDVEWIEAADNYARIWVSSRSYLLRESLGSLEQRIGRHGFLRVHRQALVRVGAVKELRRGRNGDLVAVLGTGVRIPVSRRRRAVLIRSLRPSDGSSSTPSR